MNSNASELARLRLIRSMGSIGTWEWCASSDSLTGDVEHHRICGVPELGAALTRDLFLGLVHEDDRESVLLALAAARAGGADFAAQFRIRRWNDGTVRWVDARGVFLRRGNRVNACTGVLADVTDIKENVEALRRDTDGFRMIFERNPAPMWIFDRETLRILAVNDAAVDEYGWSREEFTTLTILDLRPEEDRERLLAESRDGFTDGRVRQSWRHRLRDGSIRQVDVTADSIMWRGRRARLVLAQDETARHILEDRLRHAQKMEAVGQLAGGVAHDFNNLLTVIVSNLELARAALTAAHTIDTELAEITQAAERARTLVSQLLAYGGKQHIELRDVDLNEIVRVASSMVKRLIGDQVRLDLQLCDHPVMIRADGTLIERVIFNLAINARDAMRTPLHGHAGNGGTLTISTRILLYDAKLVARLPDLPGTPMAELAVSDTGHGMNPETLEHLFEPFFTTKPQGQGTGLGLASVFGAVQQSDGSLSVESSLGQGTCFTMLFPALPAADDQRPLTARTVPATRGEGTVLLVEDEDAVRRATRRLLERYGYQVIEASDGEVALEKWTVQRDQISAVVTDVRMPRVGGHELVRRLRAEAPRLPIVLVSGYTAENHMATDSLTHFLDKPFTGDQLYRALADVMAASAETL